MKKNSLRVLMLLFSETKRVIFELSHLSLVVDPLLSKTGLLSNLYVLQKAGLVGSLIVSGKARYFITEAGKQALSREMVYFSMMGPTTNESWTVVIVLSDLLSEPQQRSLRRLLVEKFHFASLQRAVFIAPTAVYDVIANVLDRDFQDQLLVFTEIQISNSQNELLRRFLKLQDSFSTFSSISSDVDSLLAIVSTKKESIQSDKNRFNTMFENYFEYCSGSIGFEHFYFSQENTKQILHSKIQLLSKSL